MQRVAKFFSWFLLVPYFAVRSLNVRPWFGEDARETANRTNAQGIIALMIAFAALDLLEAVGGGRLLDGVPAAAIGFCTVVPGMVATAMILRREREKRYWAEYKIMPEWRRCVFGVGGSAIALLLFVGFLVLHR